MPTASWTIIVPASFTPSDAQSHFARTIALGPGACPENLFAGDPERVLRGLKVHANTISHARLVALEETFPRTREVMGHDAFNALSHSYFDAGHGREQSLDQLGTAFPRWLEANGATPVVVALAGFEWLWLESYHAAEAPSFTAQDMAGVSSAELGEVRLAHHPAARMTRGSAPLAAALDLPGAGDWLLIARPEAEVLVHTIDDATAALFSILAASPTFFAALETFLGHQTDKDPLAAMQLLLAAGVLMKGE